MRRRVPATGGSREKRADERIAAEGGAPHWAILLKFGNFGPTMKRFFLIFLLFAVAVSANPSLEFDKDRIEAGSLFR